MVEGTGLADLSAAEQSRLIGGGEVSPVELLDAHLERCRALNPTLNAIVAFDADGARDQAKAAEARALKGERLSALDGIAITVKDNLWAKGFKATWGSRLYEHFKPDVDDIPVERVRATGAVIMAKTNTPEFALQAVTDNPLFGLTRNPWDTDLTPGGSSGGSVAQVAAGMAPLAIGTDGGGSIRRPASYTGLAGLKPSYGRVARAYGFPPSAADFSSIGPIARTVDDVALLFACIGLADRRDRASLAHAGDPPLGPDALTPPGRLSILYIPRVGDAAIDPEITESVARAARVLSGLGHEVEEADAPWEAEEINEIWGTLTSVSLRRVVEAHEGWRERIGANFVALVDAGAEVTGTEYVKALDRVAALRARLAKVMARFDALLTPASAAMPWPIPEPYPKVIAGRAVGPRGAAIFATVINALGYPAISIPADPAPSSGLPIGLQIVGRFGGDNLVLRLARQYETANPWADRWPAVG
jgi:aspartyl-tRNA(Asn)/glutamyl-tRNA(Gln) amidotransferase subunit A